MKALQTVGCWTVAISIAAMVAPQVRAQEGDPNKMMEQKKKLWDELEKAAAKAHKVEAPQVQAVRNARSIGLALFEFENEYGSFPDEMTAVEVKKLGSTKAEVKAVAANDCFFQLIAANFSETARIFSIEDAAAPYKQEEPKRLQKVENCFFSYVSGMNSAGNPGRPLVVAPLVNGKTTFDPQVLGGKAVVLRVDNSVQSFPIEPDGRVLIDGKDIFDPAQPFWNGKVPPIKWPQK